MSEENEKLKALLRRCLPELVFSKQSLRLFRQDIQKANWKRDLSAINEKDIIEVEALRKDILESLQ